MSKSACMFVFALLVAPLASADQIFKCVGKSGSDLYQNFPCQYHSMGWKPMDAQGPDISSASSSSSARPKASPAIGATHEQVKALWGPAQNTYYGELVDGRVEIWSYGDARSVMFDLTGHVSAVQP